MQFVAGIDSGSGFTKSIIVADSSSAPVVVGLGIARTGVNMEEAARRALDDATTAAGLRAKDIDYIASTGFGRYSIGFRDIQITEITSGSRGAYHLLPQTDLVLDIGSQSTRAISLKNDGKVRSFK